EPSSRNRNDDPAEDHDKALLVHLPELADGLGDAVLARAAAGAQMPVRFLATAVCDLFRSVLGNRRGEWSCGLDESGVL
ncbi:hypothetical protein ACFPIJ_03325, partial [Dactylosporangium cerinum]